MTENNTALVQQEAEAGTVAAEAVGPRKKKRHVNQQKLQDNLWGWLFSLPLIVGTVLFIYIALVMALLLSFTTYSAQVHGNVWEFLGRMFTGETDRFGFTVFMDTVNGEYRTNPWRWYQFVFTDKMYSGELASTMGVSQLSTMGATLFNTVFYLIGIPIGMILSMFLAVCMSRDIKGANVFHGFHRVHVQQSVFDERRHQRTAQYQHSVVRRDGQRVPARI